VAGRPFKGEGEIDKVTRVAFYTLRRVLNSGWEAPLGPNGALTASHLLAGPLRESRPVLHYTKWRSHWELVCGAVNEMQERNRCMWS